MSDGFYRAFEDRFRGSRELIKSRLQVYLPFIEPLIAMHPDGSAIDLGCGRGEWLELLRDSGFSPRGFDLDEGMLEACRELGLSVERRDAVAALKNFENESQLLVSGFHIAEHLPFEILRELVAEALRVLKPGGLLILETPNPENLIVGTSNFYLDPSHIHPLPPLLLAFLPEYYGFKKIKVLRLQEPKNFQVGETIALYDLFIGVSPDYSIIAQKNAEEELLRSFTAAFEKSYGVNFEDLVARYETQFENWKQHAEAMAQHAEAMAQHAEAMAQHAEAMAQHAEAELNAVYSSRSWRLTAPLRMLRALLSRHLRHP